MTKDFPTEDLRDLVNDDGPEEYTVLVNEVTSTGRWSIYYDLVFGHDGMFWRTTYSVGATESQDEYPFENDGLQHACAEVTPVEKTVTVYVPA